MRLVPVALAAMLGVAAITTAVQGQKPDAQVDPRSLALSDQARAARASGNLEQANDLLESALVVDPKNRRAFVDLAEIAKAQGLPGKAIRFYREALELEPNDVAALAGQGDALVQKGAVIKARENLAKVKRLCGGNCPEESRLAALIEKGPPPAVLSAQASAKVPAPGAEEQTRKPQ
ncbi:tetratricopeptide repeat protein [Sphingomonas sp. ID1715]|uniref:tetratricopeptide repeat protein n=1 Tax=Sphingomonas sp. ID1715 TaxID=1656898 RepID=UPI001487D5ED|nr:tetratricopeptide repeat protein [Sphingomonas sp. ID1715]NNM77660.1 tetratricopeptide repeat protein [Sphingomonas sp. ID1715]